MKKTTILLILICSVCFSNNKTAHYETYSFADNFVTSIFQESPPTPVGFVAFDNIGGNPVNSGEAFLACGPNNVGDANIEYRLFYALTSANVADPLSATEYNFGDTAGDGGGTSAFGFVISGLDPGVEYTFWLYQYNSSTSLFSEPNEVSVVTGGGSSSTVPDSATGFNVSQGDVGEASLSCGVNDVADGDIEYRLFYALSSANISDPLTAIEYTFGTTAGDGSGNAAFDFDISGLTQGVE
ncbi:hypothetical protein [Psychroflexus aestuariivivens]|uniref:hypothetical protein n=1 Tax=Psychroflexus aestuariivivens TaxID=1795040 RepID=UPI000FDBA7D8|nr:hypothetical protein [Psychroflexus aestuariivivens]